MFERIEYKVERIDGDYAWLSYADGRDAEEKCVALALLPPGIREGSMLAYEMMSYTLLS